jgi:hypothetical protein
MEHPHPTMYYPTLWLLSKHQENRGSLSQEKKSQTESYIAAHRTK